MSDQLSIRQEVTGDHKIVFDLHCAAFKQDEEAKLVDALRVDSAFDPELSLVAILNDIIVGHILFTKINIIGDGQVPCESLALAPVSVDPIHQGKGIGGKLIKKGLSKSKGLGYRSVIVLGHSDYYPRFGFHPTTKWQITAPFEVPPEVFMGIELVPEALAGCGGQVQYSTPFGL